MSAYLTRMPAGIPGDVSRKEGATIESSLVGSKTIPYGAFVKLVSGKLEPLAASDTAAVIYGLAVRPYPKQSDAVGFGAASAPAGSLCDVLRSGYMTVKLASGTAARGGQVYARVTARHWQECRGHRSRRRYGQDRGRIGLHIHGTGRRRRQHRNRLQHLGAHHVYF